MKVCIIYGSESGNSERAVKAIAKTWQGSNFEIGEIMEGATAAVRGFAALAEQYDFLVVATSSNGEGDPPFNFHPFLKALYAADDAGDKPLTGCGFAVLGFGCSHFDRVPELPSFDGQITGRLGSDPRRFPRGVRRLGRGSYRQSQGQMGRRRPQGPAIRQNSERARRRLDRRVHAERRDDSRQARRHARRGLTCSSRPSVDPSTMRRLGHHAIEQASKARKTDRSRRPRGRRPCRCSSSARWPSPRPASP